MTWAPGPLPPEGGINIIPLGQVRFDFFNHVLNMKQYIIVGKPHDGNSILVQGFGAQPVMKLLTGFIMNKAIQLNH